MLQKEARLKDHEPGDTGCREQESAGQAADFSRPRLVKTSGFEPTRVVQNPHQASVVSFDRHELRPILNVYGRKVAAGEWRDYAIDFTPAKAVFSVFRRTSEIPLFRIEKDPKLARKQGAYCVIASGGLILKRGHELARVVEVLDRKVKLVVV